MWKSPINEQGFRTGHEMWVWLLAPKVLLDYLREDINEKKRFLSGITQIN